MYTVLIFLAAIAFLVRCHTIWYSALHSVYSFCLYWPVLPSGGPSGDHGKGDPNGSDGEWGDDDGEWDHV